MRNHTKVATTRPHTRALTLACLATAVLLVAGAARTAEKTLPYQTDFSDGATGWEAVDQAVVSDFSRRDKGRSLLIKQWEKGQEDSAWLSPVINNPGGRVAVSLWAADNYLQTKDFSFSAALELIPCKVDGTLIASGGKWHYIPWEPDRFMPQFRHTYTRKGLVWEYYEATEKVNGDHFRLRLSWPKSRMKGECYFTDVRIGRAKKGWGKFTWLTFSGFNTSVNAQPDLWRQFTFVK